jgi:hypothetical protein
VSRPSRGNLGLALSLLLSLPALGDTKGPYTATSARPGWNSITHSMSSHYFDMRSCVTDPNDDYLWFESMHHWPFWPSTGIGKQLLACVNNTTWRTLYWYQSGTADYSIEYVGMCCYNSATIVTMNYRIRH